VKHFQEIKYTVKTKAVGASKMYFPFSPLIPKVTIAGDFKTFCHKFKGYLLQHVLQNKSSRRVKNEFNNCVTTTPHRGKEMRATQRGSSGGGRALHQIAFAGGSCLIALENIVMRWSKLSSSLMPIRLR